MRIAPVAAPPPYPARMTPTAFILARLAEETASPATAAVRDLVEHALGLSESFAGGPHAQVGNEVLGVIAAAWSGHPDYEPGWDVAGG